MNSSSPRGQRSNRRRHNHSSKSSGGTSNMRVSTATSSSSNRHHQVLPIVCNRSANSPSKEWRPKNKCKRWFCCTCRQLLKGIAGCTIVVFTTLQFYSVTRSADRIIPARRVDTDLPYLFPKSAGRSNIINSHTVAAVSAPASDRVLPSWTTLEHVMHTEEDTAKSKLDQRRQERLNRTRPHPHSSSSSSDQHQEQDDSRLPTNAIQTVLDVSSNSSNSTNKTDHDWTKLCGSSNASGTTALNSKSRIVITGALSLHTTLGPPLALLLAHKCGVQHVMAVDTMLPNLRKVRLRYLHTYKQLSRNIAALKFVVPTETAGLGFERYNDHGVIEHEKNYSTNATTSTMTWLETFAPTHILHFEPPQPEKAQLSEAPVLQEQHDPAISMDEHVSAKNQRLYQMKHSMLSLDQLLQYCHYFTDKTNKKITLLHVTTTTTNSGRSNRSSAAVISSLYRVHQALFATYRSAAAAHADAKTTKAKLYTLMLPTVFGPMTDGPTIVHEGKISKEKSNATELTATALYIDDALVAILQALQQQHPYHDMTVATGSTTMRSTAATTNTTTTTREITSREAFREAQTRAYRLDQEHPYGTSSMDDKSKAMTDNVVLRKAGSAYRKTLGIHTTRFPCASSCTGPTATCAASVWDVVLTASINATRGCRFVTYTVDLHVELDELFRPTGKPNQGLCRVAFVSGKSPAARAAIKELNPNMSLEQALQESNGRLKINGWTLVWLPKDDDSTITDAEVALAQMEPSRLFDSSVQKAMYTEIRAFAELPDDSLVRILQQVDAPPIPHSKRREKRPGVSVSRWVAVPPRKARSVALFASEPPLEFIPSSIAKYEIMAGDVPLPLRQVQFYKLLAKWIQSEVHRPELEIKTTIYRPFPFQWVDMGILIHDLGLEEARQLRCGWYDEHLFWGGSNRGVDELSLAYVIGKRRIEQTLGPRLADEATWIPVLKGQLGDRATTAGDSEVFLRIGLRSEDG